MVGLRRVWVLAAMLGVAVAAAGCGGQTGLNMTAKAAAAALQVSTAKLPAGAVAKSYSAALAASGGRAPYQWSVASGQLPAGVRLSSSGALTGSPQQAGTYAFQAAVKDAAGAKAQRTLSVSVAPTQAAQTPPPTLDAYGGVVGLAAPGGATGYFRVAKIGSRWVFVDPLGNEFWMLGVYDVDASNAPDGLPGTSYYDRILLKYGGIAEWGVQAARRLKSWGFNTAGEYSSAYVGAVDQYATRNTTAPIPSIGMIRPNYYSLIDSGNYAPGPVKDLMSGLDGNYHNYAGDPAADIYDPNYTAYVDGSVAAMSPPAVADSPWIIGTAVEDADDLWGFGPGPDQPTSPAGHATSNLGWIALCTNFQQTANAKYGEVYTDTKVYTKYALQAFLEQKYNNSIAALDAAWGADYTTFGDAGGFGTGTGLLDEDGRDPWVGDDDVSLSTATPAVRADLNAFMAQYVQRFFQIVTAALRKYQPDHLIFGPATLNGWNGISRQAVLAAAGQSVDVMQADAANQQIYDQTLLWAGDKPLVAWVGFTANPDSDLYAYSHLGDVATQAARAAEYASTLDQLYAYAGSASDGSLAGSQNFAGMKFWAWSDSWGEKANWGLVSLLDNAYDGKEDTVAAGVDPWGFVTGGEAKNFGDMITGVKQENEKIVTELAQP